MKLQVYLVQVPVSLVQILQNKNHMTDKYHEVMRGAGACKHAPTPFTLYSSISRAATRPRQLSICSSRPWGSW